MSVYDIWKLGLDGEDTPDCDYCGDGGCVICESYPDITCTHNEKAGTTRMCQDCRESYDNDPEGWLQFGSHKEGEERWQAFLEEMACWEVEDPTYNSDSVPF